MEKQILKFCLEKGLLLDKEVFELFSGVEDVESVKFVLEKLRDLTGQSIITKEIFYQNRKKATNILLHLPEKNQKKLEKLKIKLGLNIEITKEREIVNVSSEEDINKVEEKNFTGVKIISGSSMPEDKICVKNFVTHFRNRLCFLSGVLQQHSDLRNLVSINKILRTRQAFSIIGIIASKKVTKNKNLLFEVEDMTGKIKVLVNNKNEEIYKKAEEITLDSVIGFSGSGDNRIFFTNDVFFPDALLHEKKKASIEEHALFIGDLHFGSKLFLEKSFLKFIDYLNGKIPNTPEVDKIKYLFIVGDLVTGVGNYPGQEKDLKLNDLEEQFSMLAGILGKIRKDIFIIISPGNHDGVRIMEPQPILDEKYAWPLFNMKNVILTENPCTINIGCKKNFPGFNVLTYHGFSFPFYANNISKLVLKKAMNCPDQIMKYLLKNRHLAPTHASTQYFPLKEDALLIKEVPDIFVSAHTHKCAVSYYNNVLLVSVSCWESISSYQQKFGNTPDHCKVPVVNLKTRAVKILDFEEKEEK